MEKFIIRHVRPDGKISTTAYLIKIGEMGRIYGAKGKALRFDTRDEAIKYADRVNAVEKIEVADD